jgi:hypothetical protein
VSNSQQSKRENDAGGRDLALIALVVIASTIIMGLIGARIDDGDQVTNAVLGALSGLVLGIVLVASLATLRRVLTHARGMTRYTVPDGHIAVISRNGRRIALSQGPDIWINPSLGEKAESHDMREMSQDIPHTCKTSDRMDAGLELVVVWRIDNLETYLDRAKDPRAMLKSIVLSSMTATIGRYNSKALADADRVAALPAEIAAQARSQLSRYGIFLTSMHFTSVKMPSPPGKSDLEKETERMLELSKAIKEAGERTLEYMEKMAQVKAEKEEKK